MGLNSLRQQASHRGACSVTLLAHTSWQPRVMSPSGKFLKRRRTAVRHISKATSGPSKDKPATEKLAAREGPSSDFGVIWGRLVKLGGPYWSDEEEGTRARWKLATVIALTLGTTGVSVLFSFLGRDFFNALSEKDVDRFYQMLAKWLGALFLGIPVFVLRDYVQSTLALDWRNWMTRKLTADYFANRAFYQVQAGALVDNPDQRIAADVRAQQCQVGIINSTLMVPYVDKVGRQFTDTALGFSTGLLNAAVDLVSFSGILYTIYPPLFIALLLYSLGGTAISLRLGRPLVGLNFQQEAREADFRYGLVRVRENAESVAFYGGEASEQRLLFQRLGSLIVNYTQLLVTERNLQFFTSFYRFLIGILPAAVVAPLYFQGKIEFGVVNQSSSAFNHILNDVSLVVFQFESIAGFSAIIDRLGEFTEVLEPFAERSTAAASSSNSAPAAPSVSNIDLQDVPPSTASADSPLLTLESLTLQSPDGSATLVEDLTFQVRSGETLLIVGPSGAGKTSILRAIAGLWTSGEGTIKRYGTPITAGSGRGDIFFVPQRPYVVLGTLREQLLYPTWAVTEDSAEAHGTSAEGRNGTSSSGHSGTGSRPSDAELEAVLKKVRLGLLLERGREQGAQGNGSSSSGRALDNLADWSGILSLGEQQRLAFARVLLAKPRLVLMDESSSALDTANEAHLFSTLQDAGITYVSIGHRPTLSQFHSRVLRLLPSEETEQGGMAHSSRAKCRWEITGAEEYEASLAR